MTATPPSEFSSAIEMTRELIRLDTTNYGSGRSNGEHEAAQYVAERLRALGLTTTFIESEKNRVSIVTRVQGKNSSKPALVVHGHLDVVPAVAEDWTYDPFNATVHDGMIWGRGAVDMKNMDAMILSSLQSILGSGEAPERDLIVAFFADEENGGVLGAHHVVSEAPELFAGATEAISEVGGYSVDIEGQRAYLVQTAEKSMLWLKLTARGDASHGSLVNPRNAVASLATAVTRLSEEKWPLRLTVTNTELLSEVARISGTEFDPEHPEETVKHLGLSSRFVQATLQTTLNPTQLNAGYKQNVVPDVAEAVLDIRTLPGEEEVTLERVRALAGPDVEVEITHHNIGIENPMSTDLKSQINRSISAFDPTAVVLPYMLSGGTDNKALARLGIKGYGFAPLKLPATLDFPALFHGVDERVPMDSIDFGRDVLEHFLRNY